MEKLGSKINGPERGLVDISQWYSFIVFDVISDLMTGRPLQLLEDEGFDFWTSMIFKGVKLLRYIRVAHAYPVLWWILSAIFMLPPLVKARNRHMRFATDKAEARLQAKTDRKDIMSYVLLTLSECFGTNEFVDTNHLVHLL